MIEELVGPELPGAACAGRGNLWDDHVGRETGQERAERLELALAICRTCPARVACLDARLDNPRHLQAGVWGGRLFGARTHTCRRCGNPTPPGKSTYCGDDCRRAAAAELARAQREQRHVNAVLPGLDRCQGCGRPIEGDAKRRNCSAKCRRAFSRRRKVAA